MDFMIVGTRFAESHTQYTDRVTKGIVKVLAYNKDKNYAEKILVLSSILLNKPILKLLCIYYDF